MKPQEKIVVAESKVRESIPAHSLSENSVSNQALNMARETWQPRKPPVKPAPAADEAGMASVRKSAGQPVVEKSQPAVLTQKFDDASDESAPTGEPSDVRSWVICITRQVEKSARGIVELGQLFMKAKAGLKHGKWQELFQPGNLRFSQRSAEKLIQVAQHVALAKPPNSASLPPSLDALTLLARVNADVVQSGIDDGTIQPTMTIAEAKKFALDMLGPESAKIKKPFDRDATIKSLISRVSKALDEVPANQREDFISTLVEDIKKAIH